MFYTYDQNNSGGCFDIDHDRGIDCFVIIEAESADHADSRAEMIGIYFNGVNDGLDCECCGDRWYPTSEWAATDIPMIYGGDPFETPYDGYVHMLDGQIVRFGNLREEKLK